MASLEDRCLLSTLEDKLLTLARYFCFVSLSFCFYSLNLVQVPGTHHTEEGCHSVVRQRTWSVTVVGDVHFTFGGHYGPWPICPKECVINLFRAASSFSRVMMLFLCPREGMCALNIGHSVSALSSNCDYELGWWVGGISQT